MSKCKSGRSAVTGRFTTIKQAQRKPRTHVVENNNRGRKNCGSGAKRASRKSA